MTHFVVNKIKVIVPGYPYKSLKNQSSVKLPFSHVLQAGTKPLAAAQFSSPASDSKGKSGALADSP